MLTQAGTYTYTHNHNGSFNKKIIFWHVCFVGLIADNISYLFFNLTIQNCLFQIARGRHSGKGMFVKGQGIPGVYMGCNGKLIELQSPMYRPQVLPLGVAYPDKYILSFFKLFLLSYIFFSIPLLSFLPSCLPSPMIPMLPIYSGDLVFFYFSY